MLEKSAEYAIPISIKFNTGFANIEVFTYIPIAAAAVIEMQRLIHNAAKLFVFCIIKPLITPAMPPIKSGSTIISGMMSGEKAPAAKCIFTAAITVKKMTTPTISSSTKPQIDKNKKPVEPFTVFKSHTQMMMKKNEEYYNELSQNKKLKVLCDIHLGDARNTKWANNSIGTIITSPPYVTSYEYADIHQLTGYWYDYFDDLWQFRQNFIGTSYSSNKIQNVDSKLGQKIVNELSDKSIRIAKNVAIYFNDMTLVAKEMYRVLQPKGKACIVIGNTTVKDVHIQSAEVFWDLLKKAGFQANRKNIIKRSIPYKLMPTLRNIETGRFAKVTEPNVKKVYPNEYILVVEK